MRALIRHEVRKCLHYRAFAVVLIAVLAQIAFGLIESRPQYPFVVSLYQAEVEKIAGEWTPQKQEQLKQKNQELNNLIEQLRAAEQSFAGGEIDSDELLAARSRAGNAEEQLAVNKILLEKAEQYRTYNNTEIRPLFFYDLEWQNALQEKGLNYVYLLVVVIVLIPYWTEEFSGSMYAQLLTTEHGRCNLLHLKLVVTIAVSMILSALFSVTEFSCYAVKYGLSNGNAAVQSLLYYSECPFSISLLEYCFYSAWMRVIWSGVLAVWVSAVSVMIRQSTGAGFVVLIGAVFPTLFQESLPAWISGMFVGVQLSGEYAFTAPTFAGFSALGYSLFSACCILGSGYLLARFSWR